MINPQTLSMMKQKILYLLLALLTWTSCVQEDIAPQPSPSVGKEVVVEFDATLPAYRTKGVRANGGVNELRLLVFNQSGTLIDVREATLSAQTEQGGKFRVILEGTQNRRFIHFVACENPADWAAFNFESMIGYHEGMVILRLSTSNLVYWHRKELATGIPDGQVFTGETIPLLRNQAKISVQSTATNFVLEGFTLHNYASRGTIAPFNTTTAQFETGVVTEPQAGVALKAGQETSISTTDQYLFERHNQVATDYTSVIVKGRYNGGSSTYYKIDLIDAQKKRYDIERNCHYVVKIKSVHKAGEKTFAKALVANSHNNTALDPNIAKYKSISDGVAKLEVDEYLVLFTQPNQQAVVGARYYPSVSSTAMNNGLITKEEQHAASGEKAYVTATYNATAGQFTIQGLATLPTQQRESVINVRVQGNEFLGRTIRVIARSPFLFGSAHVNGNDKVGVNQGENAQLKFTIPNSFPPELFPIAVKITAKDIYPTQEGLQMNTNGTDMVFTYMVNSVGEKTINFKTNNRSSANSTVTLTSEYFSPKIILFTRQ